MEIVSQPDHRPLVRAVLHRYCPSAQIIRDVLAQLALAELHATDFATIRAALIRAHRENCRRCRCSPRDEVAA